MKNTIIAIVIVGLGIVGFSFFRNDKDYSTKRSGDMDCEDFASQGEAQRFFEAEGGPYSDYHGLDRDKDGIACESL